MPVSITLIDSIPSVPLRRSGSLTYFHPKYLAGQYLVPRVLVVEGKTNDACRVPCRDYQERGFGSYRVMASQLLLGIH